MAGPVAIGVLVCAFCTGAIAQSNEQSVEVLSRAFLLEEWESDHSGDRPFLANPAAVAIDDLSEIYVLDAGNHRIAVFSADGSFLRAFGRAGQGPGEFTFGGAYNQMDIAVSGDLVYVSDPMQQRIHIFDRQGGFQSSVALAFFATSIAAWGNSLYVGINRVYERDAIDILEFDTSGREVGSFAPARFAAQRGPMGFANATVIAAGGGSIAQAYQAWPLIRFHVPDKEPVELILGDEWWTVHPFRDTAEEARHTLESALSGERIESLPKYPFFSDIEYIGATERWIALANNNLVHVFQSDGKLVRSLRLDCRDAGERFYVMNFGVDKQGHLLCGADPWKMSVVACFSLKQES